MLTELRVRDLAVIADVTLPLTSGLNVLTGETGAGKSMLVDALSLLLGERASTDIVRPGARRAVVEAAFDVAGSAGITAVADDLGVDVEEDRLIVRREINVEGRNRAWVNGSPTTVAALATLGRMMVDLHGQHEAQSLLRPAAQRDILDAFGEAGDERARVEAAFDAAARLREEERDLVARRDDVLKRADYLRHVVQEIEQAKPRPGEDEALSVEGKRLANVEELTRLAERLMELLEGAEEGAALQTLGQASKTLMQLERVDDSVERWRELLEAASANLEELALALREYAADIDVDPERLQEVERRRDLLYRLTQKYGSTIDAVLATGDEARQELDLLDTAHLDLDQLSERRAAAEVELQAATDALTAKRRKAAGRLAKAVEALLAQREVRSGGGAGVTRHCGRGRRGDLHGAAQPRSGRPPHRSGGKRRRALTPDAGAQGRARRPRRGAQPGVRRGGPGHRGRGGPSGRRGPSKGGRLAAGACNHPPAADRRCSWATTACRRSPACWETPATGWWYSTHRSCSERLGWRQRAKRRERAGTPANCFRLSSSWQGPTSANCSWLAFPGFPASLANGLPPCASHTPWCAALTFAPAGPCHLLSPFATSLQWAPRPPAPSRAAWGYCWSGVAGCSGSGRSLSPNSRQYSRR